MKQILFSLFILSFVTCNVKAQEDIAPINTGAANFLSLTSDARSAGMGGTGIALTQGSNAIFHNAAASTLDSQTGGIGYTFAPLLRDFESGHSLNAIGGFYKLNKRNVILVGFRHYHYPKVEGMEIGESASKSFRPKEWSIDLGYAREIISSLSVSITTRFIHSDMGNLGGAKSANAIAFDLGAFYQHSFQFMNEANWSAGVQVSNLGSKIKYLNSKECLPAYIKAGGAVDLSFTPTHRLIATADVGYRMLPTDIHSIGISAGTEYLFMNHFKARGGYHYGNKNKGDSSYGTAGLGVSYQGVQLDFAYLFAEKENTMRNSFWISLGYSF